MLEEDNSMSRKLKHQESSVSTFSSHLPWEFASKETRLEEDQEPIPSEGSS